MMKRATAVLAALLLAGCGSPSSPESPSPSPSAPSAVPATPQPAATVTPPEVPTMNPLSPPPQPTKGEITVTGTVTEGIERGCTLLRTSDELYLLLGGDRTLIRSGSRIVVRGRTNPDMLSTCQQGTPLEVLEVRSP